MWSKKELIDKRSEFWAVLARGATLQAACDAVGVNRRTGRRWRQATGGRIPRKVAPSSGRYLSLDERLQIADLRLAGATVHAIATELGRSPSTVFPPGVALTGAAAGEPLHKPVGQRPAAEQGGQEDQTDQASGEAVLVEQHLCVGAADKGDEGRQCIERQDRNGRPAEVAGG